jgi:hypothetical protein
VVPAVAAVLGRLLLRPVAGCELCCIVFKGCLQPHGFVSTVLYLHQLHMPVLITGLLVILLGLQGLLVDMNQLLELLFVCKIQNCVAHVGHAAAVVGD